MRRNALDMEVQFLPGVGPKRASLLKTELDVTTVGDLLHTYPFRYIDRSSVQLIGDVRPGNALVQILAQVVSTELTGKGAKQRLSVLVRDFFRKAISL